VYLFIVLCHLVLYLISSSHSLLTFPLFPSSRAQYAIEKDLRDAKFETKRRTEVAKREMQRASVAASEQHRLLEKAKEDEARAEREAAEMEAVRLSRESTARAAAEARQAAVRASMVEQLASKERLRAEEKERDAAEGARAAREASLSLKEADERAKQRVEMQAAYAKELTEQVKRADMRKERLKTDPAAEALAHETLIKNQQNELEALKEETIREIKRTIDEGCPNVSESQREVLLSSLVRKAKNVRI
jgi:hypothetical protein